VDERQEDGPEKRRSGDSKPDKFSMAVCRVHEFSF
jgi:hypothetical protein